MNRIDELFQRKQKDVLNVYCTAGFPAIDSLPKVLTALQENGADIAEIGMPYSDPLADGPVIQQSNLQAIDNGMTMATLFEQLQNIRNTIEIPLILMGYMNPVMQYGIEKFCAAAASVGIDGLILPDLPMYEFETQYRSLLEQHGLKLIFLVTPETSVERIRTIDALSSGFVYAVSSSSTTGSNQVVANQADYFKRLQNLQLRNPILVGFGIKDKATFQSAAAYTNGAIIGSAYIQALQQATDITIATKEFLKKVIG